MRRRPLAFTAAVASAAFLFAWLATSARWLVLINWDNAAYLAEFGVGKLSWSSTPWDAHFAIGNVYLVGIWIARAFGGTNIDGFRLVDAVAFAGGAAIIFRACHALTQDAFVAVMLTVAWMTVWVNVFLLITLEDNVLYFAPAAALLWLSVRRLGAWRLQDSVLAGMLVGGSVLLSWQAVLYAAPPFYAALIGGPRSRSWRRRLVEAVVVVALFATLVLWCLVLTATSHLSLSTTLHVLFRRPNTLGGLGRPITYGIGQAFSFGVAHSAYRIPSLPLSPRTLGALALAVELAVYVVALWWGRRFRDWRPHLLTATMLLLSVVTSVYADVDYAYLKRYDFFPIVGVLLAASLLSRAPPWVRHALTASLLVVVVGQLVLAQRWDANRLAIYPYAQTYTKLPHPEASWYGRDGQSFYGYFRRIRQRTPQACRHVLTTFEAAEGQWNFDQPASLWSELPDHVLLGDPRFVAGWRAPLRVMTPARFIADGLNQPCAWFSDDARRLIDGVH